MTRRPGPSLSRAGASLIEMLITITIVGIATSVVVLAARRIEQPSGNSPARRVLDSSRAAVARVESITLQIVDSGRAVFATVNPDGSVVSDTSLHFDRLTTRPINAP